VLLFSLINYERTFGWAFMFFNLAVPLLVLRNYVKNRGSYVKWYPIIILF
jgi:hypothetical protein